MTQRYLIVFVFLNKMEQKHYDEIVDEIIKRKIKTVGEALKVRREVCRKYKLKKLPSIIEIFTNANEKNLKGLKFLITKPTRTISGVAPVAIMTKPIKCKHGKCTICPGGVGSVFGDVPQSYTGNEPATMRAIRNKYDPYLQVMNRLEQYVLLNQNFDKVELIVMGGTFPSFDLRYQKNFVKNAFKAMNDFSKFYTKGEFDFVKFKEFFELPVDVKDEARVRKVQKKLMKLKGKCELGKEMKRNEKSKVRCVALALETRPDYSRKKEINNMLNLGCTRVELGVQSVYDSVLKKIERGHTIQDTVKATQLLKDSFLKVGFHIMPGLVGKERDSKMFEELFTNSDFMPDALKIYPCMVMPGTKLYEKYKKGKFKPISTKEAIDRIIEGKKFIPEFCRVMRVQRDVPTKVTSAGVDITNLRQKLDEEMQKRGVKCRCIRCREPRGKKLGFDNIKLKRIDYVASSGEEKFLALEDVKNDILLGFLRMRKPYKPFRKEITDRSIGVRELHVYSSSVGLGKKGTGIQHKGLGIRLMKEAEKVAHEEWDAKKILVISGVGVREYYKKKLGYRLDGAYVSKKI